MFTTEMLISSLKHSSQIWWEAVLRTCGSPRCSGCGWRRPRWKGCRPGCGGTPRRWSSEGGRLSPWPAGCAPWWAYCRWCRSQGCSVDTNTQTHKHPHDYTTNLMMNVVILMIHLQRPFERLFTINACPQTNGNQRDIFRRVFLHFPRFWVGDFFTSCCLFRGLRSHSCPCNE